MLKLLSSMCALSLALSTSAFSFEPVATVSAAQGKVLVNQGHGFLPLVDLISLKAGDRILVGAESYAVVSYTQAGCSIEIASPQTFVISAKPLCQNGEKIASIDGAFITPANSTAGYYAIGPHGTPVWVAIGLTATTFGAATYMYVTSDKHPCLHTVSGCPN